jgi:hypothetical protein
MRHLLLLALVVVAAPMRAEAQPAACATCVRGEVLIDSYSLQPIRPLAAEIAQLRLDDPATPDQYAHVVALRNRVPVLSRLGALEDADLDAVATALCKGVEACVPSTSRTLRCLAERCTVAWPPEKPTDVLSENQCSKYTTHRRSSSLGLGFDWGTGVHRSSYPADGYAWSLGIEARMRFKRRIGAVARVDRIAGRDEATDMDGNGLDDGSTGSITRVTAMAGPSFILDYTRFESTTRYLRLDLLGGYLATQSQPGEDGPAAGADLSFQLWYIRMGLRYVQGFAGASEASMLIAHLGLLTGAGPQYSYNLDCDGGGKERRSRLAIGLEIPLAGYGITEQLGYVATGLALEGIVHLSPALDALTRADVLVFPGDERDRVIHQALLGGLRIDHGKRRGRSSGTGFFTTLMAGYTHGAALTGGTAGSGAVGDFSLAWGGQGREGAGYFRFHARFGLGPENWDYRVLLLSVGLELRFDPETWRDRT